MDKQVGIRNYEQRKKEIQEMNLTSDLLSSVTFEDIPAVQDVLQILTGVEDLTVTRVEPQRSFRNLYGHSSVSDVWAEDSQYNQYNLEIQVAENEDHLRRSRFIQSRVDSRCLGTGTEYEELPELYLIFVTEKDFLHLKAGMVEVVRVVKGMGGEAHNGVHEIYANLEHPAEDEKRRRLLSFVKDTNNPNISTEGFEHLAARVRHLKNEEGGIRFMCNVIEREWAEGHAEGRAEGLVEGRTAGLAEGRKSSIQHLMKNMKLSIQQAMNILEIPLDEQPEYVSQIENGYLK